jgi:hypothetical protein
VKVALKSSRNEGPSALPMYLLLLAAAVAWLFWSYGYVEDDAFIHLEFARSVSDGQGFSFNGQLTNGDTSPLWVLLLAAVHALGFDWVSSAKLLCGCGVLFAVAGVWRLARAVAGTAAEHAWLAPAAVWVTCVNPYFIHWSFSGMESVTALGLSAWILWAVSANARPEWHRLLIGAVLLSIGPLVRPEFLLLSAMVGPLLLRQAWQWSSGSARSGAGRLGVVLALAAVMALATLLWSLYALHAFGSIVPNTNAAKRLRSVGEVVPKMASVYIVGFAVTWVALPFAIRRLLKGNVPLTIWLLLLWPLACMVFYLTNHTAVQTRYCLVSMPSLTIAVLWLLEESMSAAWARMAVIAMTLSAAAVFLLVVHPHVANKVREVKSVSSAVAFIRTSLPPDAPIAVYSIGELAFESRHPIIDIGGITRPGVLPYLNDLPASIQWARDQGAQYYIGGDSPAPGAERVFSYTMPFLGWSFHRSNYDTSTQTGIYRLQ